ncbi:biliverdin-producing heme oxygenase [Brevundimonas vesicularis]|uniref:biliverdin-producing heme oxygenase n=1 Tax=Brevundimonas vesicularis TaxID=41276 RepID=UPI001571F2E9|nr:biliverdin-producing heme oxygenase [Brevundimonas vesicularis]NSX33149.1 biliverdin-producing heme oxygenase [Brevundimonas vesicularis]
MIASPALLALREATASAHETLEVQARIEPRLSDPATRAETVAAFYRFHAGLEPLSHPLAAALNAELGTSFEPRSRANGIAQDLTILGQRISPPARPAAPGSAGEALGWVYVAEGSMLGGRIIRRRLAAEGRDLDGLGFLDPYGEETGARWRAFMDLLDRACVSGLVTIDQVVKGGVDGFAFAHRTLQPQPQEAAA